MKSVDEAGRRGCLGGGLPRLRFAPWPQGPRGASESVFWGGCALLGGDRSQSAGREEGGQEGKLPAIRLPWVPGPEGTVAVFWNGFWGGGGL